MALSETNPFTRTSYAVVVLGLTAGTLAIPFDLRLAFLPAVLVCGWSQIGGLWGTSLLGALTPLGKVAQSKKLWLQCALAYTAAGAVSAAAVGLCLGQIGRWLGESHTSTKFYCVSLLSLLLAAREWGWISFRLPERRRQTEKAWVHQFGFVMASAMWGFHIGLGFATWATFGGFWVVVALALVLSNPLNGGVLMLVYWLGRALPVWLAPSLLSSPSVAVELPATILRSRSIYHRIAGFVLAWSSGVAMLVALRT